MIRFLPIDGIEGAGAFTGALTNTPAMAAIVDALPTLMNGDERLAESLELPVIGYSLAYPIGVFGVIASIGILSKVFRIDHHQEALDAGVAALPLHVRDIRVTKADLPTVTELPSHLGLDIIISRIEYKGRLYIPAPGDTVSIGDVLSVVGTEEEIARAAEQLGDLLEGDPTHDGRLEFRRIFVSASDVVGVPLSQLHRRMDGMMITRIRRGDVDMVAEPEMRLELGDRVRVVAQPGEDWGCNQVLR